MAVLVVGRRRVEAEVVVVEAVEARMQQPQRRRRIPAFHRPLVLSPVLIALTFVRAARELLLPLIAADLGATPAEIGMLSSASFAVDTALVPVAGPYHGRYGRRYAGVPSLFSAPLASSCWL